MYVAYLTSVMFRYFAGFKQSVYHSKHEIDVLTGSKIYLSDILYDDTAFSYFTEVDIGDFHFR